MNRRLLSAVAVACAIATAVGCGGDGAEVEEAAPAPRTLPHLIFDDLALGMTRSEVSRVHRIRPSLTAGGQNLRVWVYSSRGEHTTHLTFSGRGKDAELTRIDVHFGPSRVPADQFIGRFEKRYGPPEVFRRKAAINTYGDRSHDQYETIWSDATRHVYLTERVPTGGGGKATVYYLSAKRSALAPTGPPTGYVPPPPPEGEDDERDEDSIF